MDNQIPGLLPAHGLRLGSFLGIAAAVLSGIFAAPAGAATQSNADDARRAPARQQFADNDQNRDQHRGGGYHGGYHGGYRGGYHGGGERYYGPPPIVYAPPGYYRQPGVSLNFGIPIY